MSKNRNLSGGLFAAPPNAPTPLTIKQTSLSKQIADWLDARLIYNDRLPGGKIQTPRGRWLNMCGRGGERGTPDRFAVIGGRIIFIEVRTRGAKPTAEQLERHDRMRDAGAIVFCCDSFEYFVGKFTAVRAAIEMREKELFR